MSAAADRASAEETDVLVVGAGMAGLSAAIAAREADASVIVIEKAPEAERGGNTRFSNGAIRAVYRGVEDIDALVGGLSAAERERAEFGSYSREQYYDDLARVTQYRSHPDMADMLIENSRDTLFWLQQQGLRFVPLYEWQFKLPDGRVRFSGGSALEVNGAGEGASEALFRSAERRGARVFYRHQGAVAHRRGGPHRRRHRPQGRGRHRHPRAPRDPRLRRLRGECRMAHALSRPVVGPRQGARLALQHR